MSFLPDRHFVVEQVIIDDIETDHDKTTTFAGKTPLSAARNAARSIFKGMKEGKMRISVKENKSNSKLKSYDVKLTPLGRNIDVSFYFDEYPDGNLVSTSRGTMTHWLSMRSAQV